MYEREKSEIRALRSHLLATSRITTTAANDSDDVLVTLAPDSVAIRAAVAGLDKELTRLEREERLVRKFTADSGNANSGGGKTTATGKKGEEDAVDMDYVQMTSEDFPMATPATDDTKNANDDGKDEEEWEEAGRPSPAKGKHPRDVHDEEDSRKSEYFQKLSSSAVARIAGAGTKASTPLGALGLALHAALMELSDDENGNGGSKQSIFKCTGVPDADVTSQFLGVAVQGKKGGGGGGFAPPVRELPRGQLVPPKWEENVNNTGDDGVVAFRYKCGRGVYSTSSSHTNDATTLYLALHLPSGSDEASVAFGTLPSSSSKGKSAEEGSVRQKLKFPLGRHVNLDGFRAAKAKNGGGGGAASSSSVPPSLFYISLSELLARFDAAFGGALLLPRADGGSGVEDYAGTAASAKALGRPMSTTGTPMVPGTAPVVRPDVPPDSMALDGPDNTDPLRVADSQRRGGRHGDFEGDLLPGGPMPGGLHGIPPRGGGSQVGPNHPMFDNYYGDDSAYGYGDDDLGFGNGGGGFGVPGVGGGMGMRPRFDPYGPPRGPTEPGRGGHFPGRGSRLGRGRGRGRGGRGDPAWMRGGSGNPNPDHMPPPGGDYFS